MLSFSQSYHIDNRFNQQMHQRTDDVTSTADIFHCVHLNYSPASRADGKSSQG